MWPKTLTKPGDTRTPGLARKVAFAGSYLRLRGRDSNPNFLIQSQASYH